MSTPPLSRYEVKVPDVRFNPTEQEAVQKVRYQIALEQIKWLNPEYRARLIAILNGTSVEDSRIHSAAASILSPRGGKGIEAFHQAVRAGDKEAVRKMLAEGGVDVNAMMSVAPRLTPEEQGRRNNTTPSAAIAYPAPLTNLFSEERTIKVPPVYYALEQALGSKGNSDYEFIFLALLNHKETDLNQRRQALVKDESEGFTILHLAALKGPPSILTKILEAGRRVDLNKGVELGPYDKYTALDLAVVRVSNAPTHAELKQSIVLYDGLEKAGCKHVKQKKTSLILNPPRTPRELLNRRGRASSQTDLEE